MAMRGTQRVALRLWSAQLQQPVALLDRCLSSTAQSSSASMRGQVAAVGCSALLPSRSLHGSSALRADEKDVDAANQEIAAFFGLQPAEPPQPQGSASSAPKPDAPDASQASAAPQQTFAYRPSAGVPSSESRAQPKPTASGRLTHIDQDGRAAMVNVGKKLNTQREAVASARVLLGPEVYALVASNAIAKGDVLTVAELAGIMAAKHTSLLIPLCHNISLTYVDVKLKLVEEDHAVDIRSEVRTVGPTGVEMEALTAASTAALTIYDMCKAVSRRLVIDKVVLEFKAGGKSGTYRRSDDPALDKKA